MENDNSQLLKNQFRNREFTRMFEGIEDEIAILTASAKFNYTTRKSDQNTLKITLAYIEDTKKMVDVLKNRMNLLMETTR